jgi:hypothetical protein
LRKGWGLALIFDDELPPEVRLVKVPIGGQVIRSYDEIVCIIERRTSQVISGFLAIAQEYIDERRSLIAARQKLRGGEKRSRCPSMGRI